MDAVQNETNTEIAVSGRGLELSQITSIGMLSPQQLAWVDYCVVQGLITNEDGTYRKMTIDQFAKEIGVGRASLYRWRDGIPKFWDFVAERRPEIFGKTRVQKMWNAMYLQGIKGDVRAQQTWLANADKAFRMPTQPVQVEAGNSWAALINRRRHNADKQAIEGEIVSDEQSHTN